MHSLGFNYRLTDIQCALGHSQLSKLEEFVKERTKLKERYSILLGKLGPYVKPIETELPIPAWHLSVALINFEELGVPGCNAQLYDLGIGTKSIISQFIDNRTIDLDMGHLP